ncbi:MAG: futalosine hydrolase [Thermodesulfobacteriota bacterium]
MLLVTAATDLEMGPLLSVFRHESVVNLVTGIGPVETAVRLSSWLHGNAGTISSVVNIGVAGAYIQPRRGDTPELLDICLAEREVLGDLGVCLGDRIEPVAGKKLRPPGVFEMDGDLLARAEKALAAERLSYFRGVFVTVSCASGTARRGEMLARRHQGLCENMEGAAVARVCKEFALPCLELRCISNLVEDRDTSRWQLGGACRRAGEAAALVLAGLLVQTPRKETRQ